MSETDEMTIDERRKYLHKMRLRYWQATDRPARGRLLDEIETVTGLHRKSILRLLHGDLVRQPRQIQRGCTYGEDVAAVVAVIAHSLDYPCAERLRPNLVWLADHLARHGELTLSPEVRALLEQISVPTLRQAQGRLLRRLLQQQAQVPARIAYRAVRRPAPNPLLQGIPIPVRCASTSNS